MISINTTSIKSFRPPKKQPKFTDGKNKEFKKLNVVTKIQGKVREINFIEKIINTPKEASVKAITDFFDSKELLFTLGLNIQNFKVLSYPLEEIILEKYRATLTRESLKERDIFDLFLIKGSLKVDTSQVVDKIRSSALIKRELEKTVSEKLALLQDGKFFKSDEKIEDLAITKYNKEGFEKFKTQLQPILTRICQEFLKK